MHLVKEITGKAHISREIQHLSGINHREFLDRKTNCIEIIEVHCHKYSEML
jgi:hypothetical protein